VSFQRDLLGKRVLDEDGLKSPRKESFFHANDNVSCTVFLYGKFVEFFIKHFLSELARIDPETWSIIEGELRYYPTCRKSVKKSAYFTG